MQWLGLVRNVMLGRQGLTRDVLLGVVRGAGGLEPQSYLTTGNVTFHASGEELDRVVEHVENGIAQVLGRRELFAVRSVSWLRSVVTEDPFTPFVDGEWDTEIAFLRHDAPPVDGIGWAPHTGPW